MVFACGCSIREQEVLVSVSEKRFKTSFICGHEAFSLYAELPLIYGFVKVSFVVRLNKNM